MQMIDASRFSSLRDAHQDGWKCRSKARKHLARTGRISDCSRAQAVCVASCGFGVVLSVTFLIVGEFAIIGDAESWAPWRELKLHSISLNAGVQRTLLMNCFLSR